MEYWKYFSLYIIILPCQCINYAIHQCMPASLGNPTIRNKGPLDLLTSDLHFLLLGLDWVLRVLFPSSSPIWDFSFCCSCTLCSPFDFSEEDEDDEERASRHSFWDCRRALSLASSPQPCISARWWVRQKRLEQKSHCRRMKDALALHLTEWGRREGKTD